MVSELNTRMGIPPLAIANQYHDQQTNQVKRARYRLISVRGVRSCVAEQRSHHGVPMVDYRLVNLGHPLCL